MSKKTTIRTEGEGSTAMAALVTWALMKLGVRPFYEGDNRAEWQALACDEHELEIKVRALIKDQDRAFVVSEQESPVVAELQRQLDEANAAIEKKINAADC